MTGKRGSNLERFETSFIPEPNSGCWLWDKAVSITGYGWFYYPPQNMVRAHIVAWELYRGSRKGLHVLHSCDTPCCVNPDHLRLGTHQDNMNDRETRQRRAPPKGIKNGRATVTEHQVLAIRADQRPVKIIAAIYKLPITTIRNIKTYYTWKHLP